MTKVDMFFNLIAGGIIVLLLMFSGSVFSQQSISMADTESRREVSMANAQGKTSDGVYRYYAKGDNEPYTGVLFAKYPNGNFSSWQEYVDGLGQGQWINYYENGNYKEKGFYKKNLVEGPISKYYENGVLKAEGSYKDWRVKVGNWKYYDEDGNLLSTNDYGEKGSLEEVEEYFERGEISKSWYVDIKEKNGFFE